MSSIKHSTALVILDGFGYRKETHNNAIAHADTPTFDYLWNTYPHALLKASGQAVGLPEASIGNSQIGHRIIGAGRIIAQPFTIFNNAIRGEVIQSEQLSTLLKQLSHTNGVLHIMGLLSDAGVHSHINHLYACINTAEQYGIKHIMLHLFLDGRDVPPQSALSYITQLKRHIQKGRAHVCIGSVTGRFYAMDRDENWERTKKSYELLTDFLPKIDWLSIKDALEYYYDQGTSDEFIPPTQFNCFKPIRPGDGILFFNFRPDRAQQLTQAFVSPGFKEFATKKINLSFFVTPFSYGPSLHTTLFTLPKIEQSLKEVLINAGKTVFSIAETEKYAHITYFFSGGNHELGMAQTNILIPSIKSKDYVNYPCMSAQTITETVVNSVKDKPFDFYLINYANADMVAHSGNFDATVQAIECLDKQIKALYDTIVVKKEGTLYITADHGNAEDMSPKWITSHTTHPVPFIMVRKDLKDTLTRLPLSNLSDIASLILKQLHLPVPKAMK